MPNGTNLPVRTSKEAEVENWKIKPSMKRFIREYRKIDRVSNELGNTLQGQLSEADQTRKMLEEFEGMKRMLLRMTPESGIYELEGQDLEIRY